MPRWLDCNDCGWVAEEGWDEVGRDPKPCPRCNGQDRGLSLDEQGQARGFNTIFDRRWTSPKGRPGVEVRSGDERYHATGEWRKRYRRVDRAADRYEEIITDPSTGEIIQKTEEPLSEHFGHGADKGSKGGGQ